MNLERVDGQRHPGRIELECHLFGHDPRPATAAHIETCPQCADAVRELEEQREAFLRDHPPGEALRPALLQLDLQRTTRRSPRLPAIVAAGGAAALIALLISAPWRHPAQDAADPLRTKGGAALSTQVLADSSWQPPSPGQWPTEGQEVRFSVFLPRPGYPALLALQDDGTTYALYPVDEAQPLVPGGRQTILAGAAVLDGYAGGERVYLFTSRHPWTPDGLEALLRSPELWEPVAITSTPLREAPR